MKINCDEGCTQKTKQSLKTHSKDLYLTSQWGDKNGIKKLLNPKEGRENKGNKAMGQREQLARL